MIPGCSKSEYFNMSDKLRNILYNCNTPALPLARKGSSKYSRSKTITQAKSKSLVGNIISYETSHWAMSTLAAASLALVVGISQRIWSESFVKGHMGCYLSFCLSIWSL